MKPGWEQAGRIWADAERLGGPVTWMQRSGITGGFVEAALAFIREAEAQERPFYVNVWPDDVHTPLFPPVERWGNSKRELYLAVLEEMDRQFAPLFDYVRKSDALRGNTLVLICSDNGPEPGAGRAGPLRGCKTNLYEGGIRSPLIVWAPGLMAEEALGGRNGSSVFSAIDLVPSLLKATGARKPDGVSFDGEELLDTLLGKSQKSRQAPIFFSRPPDRKRFYGHENLPDLAVRHGKWKLLCDYDGSRQELYDLKQDPGERNNVAAKHARIAGELTSQVLVWWQSTSEQANK
jgi:uncharacterized sulfatase